MSNVHRRSYDYAVLPWGGKGTFTASKKGNHMRLAHSKSARILTGVTAGAVAVTIGALAAPSANAGHVTPGLSGVSHHSATSAAKITGKSILFQNGTDDTGIGIVSQDFTDSGFDIYDAQGADDFKVPKGHTWKIKEVDATGVYFNGPGPADSETVTIYKNNGGVPGDVVKSKTKVGTDTGGSFVIRLGKRGIKLTKGTYWLSVVPTMAFSVGGEWGWETAGTQTGAPGQWQNPGGGLGTSCSTWGAVQTCIPSGEGPDFMFTLQGTSS